MNRPYPATEQRDAYPAAGGPRRRRESDTAPPESLRGNPWGPCAGRRCPPAGLAPPRGACPGRCSSSPTETCSSISLLLSRWWWWWCGLIPRVDLLFTLVYEVPVYLAKSNIYMRVARFASNPDKALKVQRWEGRYILVSSAFGAHHCSCCVHDARVLPGGGMYECHTGSICTACITTAVV